ncbi:MAG: hypothetical protein KKD21_01265 [Proteobacteria bacterium]|nr:hypothetical protein [Pseudomonadota bacterium]MBU1695658.1 hypothetical protein [Pseudomonadota bacterium]
MERAMLWFKCAAMHDPVRPVIKKQAQVGWEAKNRQVDLVIEGPLKGDELLKRMSGWFTADVYTAIEIFKLYGKLKVLDDVDLVVETQSLEEMELLSKKLADVFQDEAWIEAMPKKRLE